MLYYTIFLLFRFWLIQFPAVTMLDKKQGKWRGTEEQRKTLLLGYFLFILLILSIFLPFHSCKENKTNYRKWLWDCNRMSQNWYDIDIMLNIFSLSYFLLFFSFSWFLFFLLDLFAIDCGFSRSTSVSTILFFFMLFGIHFFFIYFNKWLIFFCDVILELWYESEACLVCV